MAYTTVSVKRSSGGILQLYVPEFINFKDSLTGSFTIADAEANVPDFDGQFTFLCSKDTEIIRAAAAGFSHVIDVRQFNGERWTLSNDNYLTITKTGDDYNVIYYDKNNNVIGSYVLSGTGAYYYGITLFSSSAIENVYYPLRIGLNNNISKFEFVNNQCPTAIYDSCRYAFWLGAGSIDPYDEGGTSGTGGGTGTFSGTGDAIGIPSLPTLSATSAGFITLFNPSAAQMASLAGYMWTGAFDINTFRKIFADPMDCILGLSIVPVDVPAGSSAEVKVGNIGTGIYMTTAASQYVEVDCGTLNVEEFWGAYLDYEPYTKAEIYLPYIGTHPIAVDDIMGKSVHVVYHVDILSGACVAYVQCGSSVLYSFNGQCSSSIPITGNDWTNVVNGVLSIAGSIGSMVATGGASAPAAVGSIVSTAVNQMKPSVEKSGSLSGTGGMMGIQVPYLILTRPRQALPANQNSYTGYPSFITTMLGDLSGYTEVEEIHLENVPATSGELSEILSLLKGGVIL